MVSGGLAHTRLPYGQLFSVQLFNIAFISQKLYFKT
jgi:hypothetical protein